MSSIKLLFRHDPDTYLIYGYWTFFSGGYLTIVVLSTAAPKGYLYLSRRYLSRNLRISCGYVLYISVKFHFFLRLLSTTANNWTSSRYLNLKIPPKDIPLEVQWACPEKSCRQRNHVLHHRCSKLKLPTRWLPMHHLAEGEKGKLFKEH